MMKPLLTLIQAPPSWLTTPPLSLSYLATYLKQQNIPVKVIDLNTSTFQLLRFSPKEWLTLDTQMETALFVTLEKKFPSFLKSLYTRIQDTRYIGFSLLQRNAPFSLLLADAIVKRFPKKHIIFGGPHTLFLERQHTLNPHAYWVIGEGERPLYSIVTEKAKKKVIRFKEINDLDTLPFLEYAPLSVHNTLPLIASRGCPHHCAFCTEHQLNQTVRFHSPAYTVAHIQHLQKRYSRNTFIFCDSLINFNRQWLYDFCSLLIKKQCAITWEAQMRIEPDFPVELAQLMKSSGCYNLFIGLESASDTVLKRMQKGFNTATARQFIKTLAAAKLHFEVSLIFGYPQETDDEFNQTLSFIIEHKNLIPKIAQANPFVDYQRSFLDQTYPTPLALRRTARFLKIMEREKIRHTKSFINNLIYPHQQ